MGKCIITGFKNGTRKPETTKKQDKELKLLNNKDKMSFKK